MRIVWVVQPGNKMSTEPPTMVLYDPKDVNSYIDKLLRYEENIMKLWHLPIEEFSGMIQVSGLTDHYYRMIDEGKPIPSGSCIYSNTHSLEERWREWIKSNPLTLGRQKECDILLILFDKHRRRISRRLNGPPATKAKSTGASLSYHVLPPNAKLITLMRDKHILSRVSRSQYRLAGACTLLCIAAVFTDGVSDGYPTRGTLFHFFCLGAMYVALHIALTMGLQQQEQLTAIGETNGVHKSLDPLMVYLPLCMAICPHLCSSVLYFGRGVNTKPPVDDMMLTACGLWIAYAWFYHQTVVPRRRDTWVIILALKSILWACEYIASGEISVSSSRLQYHLVRLGFPHGNTLYLLSGTVRYGIASRFMMHKGVHMWSRYTSIVVCLFLLTCPYFIYPDLTVSRAPTLYAYAKEPSQQHTPDKHCNMTAVNGVLSTFMGKAYAVETTVDSMFSILMSNPSTTPCYMENTEECNCADTTVCRSVSFRQDNDKCIEVYLPNDLLRMMYLR